METNKTKSVGEEFIEWAKEKYSLEAAMSEVVYKTATKEQLSGNDPMETGEEVCERFADKINDIIHNRVIELLKEQNTKR